MNTSNDLLAQESHFEFGKNWASYAKLITESQIDIAVVDLQRLLGGRLDGKRFLDIGCGSGLHSLAALRLGASEVVAVDIDPDSVETTREVLRAHASEDSWRTLKMSVFDLDPKALGEFDVVYSWGVLHHTGDMCRALALAGSMVCSGGHFAFALYRRTLFCWFWKAEKRWYADANPRAQKAARAVYLALFRLACPLRLRSYKRYVAKYRAQRGMDFFHDVHDWMGGWPYESILPRQVDRLMLASGFKLARSFARAGFVVGVFGSGCDEYLYSKSVSAR
jgi:2-polyprenyl-6-hydroxyphenyl methylase/3-demethylubiquinone-9 3-methyltransferase